MKESKSIEIENEEEMINQLKILLNNGYDIAVCRNINELSFNKDISYTIIFKKSNKSK